MASDARSPHVAASVLRASGVRVQERGPDSEARTGPRSAIRGAMLSDTPCICGSRVALLTDAAWMCGACGHLLEMRLPDSGSEAA